MRRKLTGVRAPAMPEDPAGAGPDDGRLRVRVLEASEFDAAQPLWDALVARMPYPNPMCGWAWTRAAFDCLEPGKRPWILAVYRAGVVCALLPLVRMGATARCAWFDHGSLAWPGAAASGADHHDLIASVQDAAPAWAALAQYLDGEGRRAWVQLRIPLVREGSVLLDDPAAAAPVRRCQRAIRAPWLPLPATMAQFVAGLTGRERERFRWQRRERMRTRLQEQGVHYHAYARGEFAQALEDLFRLHGGRAQAKGIASALAPQAVERFHRRVVELLPDEQIVLRGLLREGVAIAVIYGFRLDNRIFFFNSGFDQSWAEHAPGQVVMTELVAEAMRSGCVEFNFLQGEEPYKGAWTARARDLYHCTFYARGLRGRLLRALDDARARVRALRAHAQEGES